MVHQRNVAALDLSMFSLYILVHTCVYDICHINRSEKRNMYIMNLEPS